MAELVVKDNALIQASYTLDTVEQRLILLAIAEARETGQGITEN
ncbi:RepB family plasmid replication initiator protein, partial [Acinetobacter sp. KAM396]